jgi:hypothetical protein
VCNLAEYDGTITADHYQHIIHCALPSIEAFFPQPPFYIQQDGASAHHTNSTIKFLESEMPNCIPKEHWPPNSPDLSPTKNLWAITDELVKSLNPSSQAAMCMFIFNKWKLQLGFTQDLPKSNFGNA